MAFNTNQFNISSVSSSYITRLKDIFTIDQLIDSNNTLKARISTPVKYKYVDYSCLFLWLWATTILASSPFGNRVRHNLLATTVNVPKFINIIHRSFSHFARSDGSIYKTEHVCFANLSEFRTYIESCKEMIISEGFTKKLEYNSGFTTEESKRIVSDIVRVLEQLHTFEDFDDIITCLLQLLSELSKLKFMGDPKLENFSASMQTEDLHDWLNMGTRTMWGGDDFICTSDRPHIPSMLLYCILVDSSYISFLGNVTQLVHPTPGCSTLARPTERFNVLLSVIFDSICSDVNINSEALKSEPTDEYREQPTKRSNLVQTSRSNGKFSSSRKYSTTSSVPTLSKSKWCKLVIDGKTIDIKIGDLMDKLRELVSSS